MRLIEIIKLEASCGRTPLSGNALFLRGANNSHYLLKRYYTKYANHENCQSLFQ
jgi:hypothetical protein